MKDKSSVEYRRLLYNLEKHVNLLETQGHSDADVNSFILLYLIETDQVLKESFSSFLYNTWNGVKGWALETIIGAILTYGLKLKPGTVVHRNLKIALANIDISVWKRYIAGDPSACGDIGGQIAVTIAEILFAEIMKAKISEFIEADSILMVVLRNAIFNLDTGKDGVMVPMISKYLDKTICKEDFREKILSQIGSPGRVLSNFFNFKLNEGFETQEFLIESRFQKKMKSRLKKQMARLLDGGRKDLTKYGGAFTRPRQKISNAFLAEEEIYSSEVKEKKGDQ